MAVLYSYWHRMPITVPTEQCLFLHRRLINITLSCNANTGKCTGILQCLVNSSKHSSGWYATVRKTLPILIYGIN